MTLPRALSSAVDRAEIFSSDDQDNNVVKIEIEPGQLRIRSKSAHGYYKRPFKLKYKGEPRAFIISPKLLMDLLSRHTECVVGEKRIKVDAGSYVYASCIGSIERNGDDK